MIRPDVLTCWPVGCDYPLWRVQVARDRVLLGEVVIALTYAPATSPDISDFLRDALPFAHFHDEQLDDRDWYDPAQQRNLALSSAEWVWFTEPDFLYTPKFLRDLLTAAEDYDMVCAVQESGRLDPGCFLVRRAVVDATSCDLSQRDDGDNFDAFAEEVRSISEWASLQRLGLSGWRHLTGISNGSFEVDRGEAVSWGREKFVAYLNRCLEESVVLEPDWRGRVTRWLSLYGN